MGKILKYMHEKETKSAPTQNKQVHFLIVNEGRVKRISLFLFPVKLNVGFHSNREQKSPLRIENTQTRSCKGKSA